MTQNQVTGYSGLQISLHWAIAALVTFQLIFGESMTTVVDATEEGTTAPVFDTVIATAHYWAGLAILALVLTRLMLRIWRGVPPKTEATPSWMGLMALALHWVFYALLLAMPIVGLLALYVSPDFGNIHALGKPVFIVLIGLHVVAALFHQLMFKDATLRRIFVAQRG